MRVILEHLTGGGLGNFSLEGAIYVIIVVVNYLESRKLISIYLVIIFVCAFGQ